MSEPLLREQYRPASSGEGRIYSRVFLPQGEPVALIELVHGMSEHIERYDGFARFLAGKGFVVFGNDHAGHGKSAEGGTYGYFAKKDGWEHVLRDMDALLDEMKKEYPNLPAFMLGHSMGSMLARSYVTRHGEKLAGAIFSGTIGPSSAAKSGHLIAALASVFMGGKKVSKRLNDLSVKGNLSRIENPRTRNAWLTRDEKIEDDYTASELCGISFTNRGFYDMTGGILEISSPQWARGVDKSLPVYLFSGDQDPVGSYGAGVRAVYDALVAAGVRDVELKLYEGGRHEMLNELNKQEVYEDVLGWLLRHLPASAPKA